ncbi:MAG: OmpA family protein [Moraxellaceae bacterium]
MNTRYRMTRLASAMALGLGVLSLLACQSAMKVDPAVGVARAELTDLQSSPKLASHAQSAIADAEVAVVAAEKPQKDAAVQSHLAYLATNKVRAARALATARSAEDNLKNASTQRDQMRLTARTQEANQAHAQADSARKETTAAQLETTQAKERAASFEQQANDANARNSDLEHELAYLNAKKTDRGIVFTLGDVLFATGKSDLRSGAMANFDRLAETLKKQPDRHITIEGHTDSVGSESLNLALSQQRADAVKDYLVSRGTPADNISTTGKGESSPLVSNDTTSGRQKNRRVEVIIENEATTSAR